MQRDGAWFGPGHFPPDHASIASGGNVLTAETPGRAREPLGQIFGSVGVVPNPPSVRVEGIPVSAAEFFECLPGEG
jgi:hypothetical protein